MPTKLSAEERQLWEAAIVKERVGYSDGPIRFEVFEASDDPANPAFLATQAQKRELRERLKLASDDEVLFEGYNLGLRRTEVIGPSLFEQEQSDRRVSRIEARIRKLLLEHPGGIPEDSAYRMLRLYARRKGEPPRMEREEFHLLYLAVVAEKSALTEKTRQ
jgi:hypothetical protein